MRVRGGGPGRGGVDTFCGADALRFGGRAKGHGAREGRTTTMEEKAHAYVHGPEALPSRSTREGGLRSPAKAVSVGPRTQEGVVLQATMRSHGTFARI